MGFCSAGMGVQVERTFCGLCSGAALFQFLALLTGCTSNLGLSTANAAGALQCTPCFHLLKRRFFCQAAGAWRLDHSACKTLRVLRQRIAPGRKCHKRPTRYEMVPCQALAASEFRAQGLDFIQLLTGLVPNLTVKGCIDTWRIMGLSK